MKLIHKILTVACLSSAALVLGLAQADDAPPAVQAFLDNLQRQTSAKPAYDSLKVDGGNVTIINLTLTKEAKDNDPGLSVKTAQLDFTGITDQGNSLWQIGKSTFTNTSVQMTGKDAALSATIPAASAEGWYIRAVPATPTPKDELLSSLTFANKMTSGPITINATGQMLTIDSIDTTWNGDPATGAGKFSLKVNNLAVPQATVALFDTGSVWKQLGYDGLNFDIATDGDLTSNGDTLGYAFNLSLAGRNIGALSLSAAVDNLPVAAYAQMLKDQTGGRGIDFATLSPQLQNVDIKGGSLRFDDASITKKILPLAAAMQGMDEKVLLASIPPTIQLTLVQLQNEALTKQAVDAVTAFLADPKSLMLSIKPAAPMKLLEFNALDPAKPGEAITKRGVSITANQ